MDQRSAIRRRLVSVPVLYLLTAVVWILSPILLLVALVVDVVRWAVARRPFIATRGLAMLLVYTAGEAVGVALAGIGWVRCRITGTDGCLVDNAFGIQLWWAELLFQATSGILGLTFVVEGEEAVDDGPFILLSRHASIIDTLLPTHFVARPHHRHVRYVLKDELLIDPALDIAGNRLPNCFVRRGSDDSAAEAERVRELAATLGDDEAILIFPEGSRFTPEKRTRALRRLAERDPAAHDRSELRTHVLPPRPLGTLAILEGSDADVVVLNHRGLDGLARLEDIWRGEPIGRTVELRFERHPRATVPEGRDERIAWLDDVWDDVDRWVGERTD